MKASKWELKDVIMMAILGVVFAAVYLAVFQGGLALSTALTPLGLSALFIFCYELYYLNYIALAPALLAAQLAVRFVSAVVFSGVVCKLAGDGLAKTGVVKSYAIGVNADTGKVYEEEDD